MEGKTLTASDAIALQNSGYGRNCDGFGDGYGAWFWIIIILFFAYGNNGWGNRNGQDTLMSDEFIKRDIFNTNQNVSTTGCQTQRDVLESRYTNQLGLCNLGSQMQNCCCDVEKEILQNRYDNALQTNTLQAQMSNNALTTQMELSQCCCNLRAEGLANTQKILDKMCESEINTLRDRLNERDRELQSAQLQISQISQTSNIVNSLRPYPTPAYLTCSPYMSSYYAYNGFGNCGNNCCGCGNNLI